MNLSSVQGWNSVLSLQLNWCLRPGKGCEDTTTGYCKSKSHIKVIGPDVGSPTEDVRCSEMKTEDTWKNAIPNEIPAMIPRLASMTLVTSVKQPWKQTNPKISGKLFLFFVFFFTAPGRFAISGLQDPGSGLTVVYTCVAALSWSFRVSGEHLVGSLQQLVGKPFSLK